MLPYPYMNPLANYPIPPYMNVNPMITKAVSQGAPPLYIGNLDETVHEEQLFSHFSKYGAIHSLKIVKDRATNRSRGYAYVNFMQAKDAENARLLAQYEKIGRNPIRIMYKRNLPDIHETNVFVKNIDPSVTFKELHNLFNQAGKVLSVKIASSRDQSLGYGYVQMEKKEDALRAIETLNGSKLKEKEISISEFVPKGQRGNNSMNNLYVKNLPQGKSQQELENVLRDNFGKYGNITSLAVKYSENHQKHCAFVCFERTEDAQRAVDDLHDKDVFGVGEPLYINWHQTRYVRDSELKRKQTTAKNDNNLYVKNLKLTVTEEDLKLAFSVFGEVTSAAVKVHEPKPNDKRGYGFIAFKVPADAQKAIAQRNLPAEIKELFIPEHDVFITFWQPKQERERFKATKMRGNFAPRGPSFGNFMGAPYQTPFMPMPGFPFNPNFSRRFHNQRGYNAGPRGRQMAGGRVGGQMGGPHSYGGQRMGAHRGGQRQYGQQQQQNPQRQEKRAYSQQQQHQERVPSQVREQPKERAQQQQQPTLDVHANLTVQNLKDKLDDFLKLDAEKQRNILGELLYPKIVVKTNTSQAPKITGMLVDFDVLTVQDVLEMLDDEQLLDERIQEALELINQEN